MAEPLLLLCMDVCSCGDWNVVFVSCSSFWSYRNAQYALKPFLPGQRLPLPQHSSIPCLSATSVGCHSLGTQSLLVTVKVFTWMAFCGFPSLSLGAHLLYSSLWQLCALLLYCYTLLWISVMRGRRILNTTNNSVCCSRNGTGWTVVKDLPLLWTYCNFSRLLPVF